MCVVCVCVCVGGGGGGDDLARMHFHNVTIYLAPIVAGSADNIWSIHNQIIYIHVFSLLSP